MKKVVCFCLAICLGVLGAGCVPGDRENQPPPVSIRIGVSVYDPYDTFIRILMDHFNRLAKEKQQASQVTITILQESASGDQVVQNSQIESLIQAGCDILCVNLVDRTDATVVIDRAEAAGVPIIFFNRELVEEDLERWEKLYYVGASAFDSGRLQAEIVAGLCENDFAKVDKNGDGALQYVMLEGEAGHQDAVVRTEFAVNTLTEKGYVLERLEDEIANWMRAQAETKMSQWLVDHPEEIEVVFANNDDMALGAVDALLKKGVQPENWPAVVGIDGTPVGLQGVKNGYMVGTVYNDGIGQAACMLELAFALAMEQPLPILEEGKYIRLPYQIVTPENVDEYLQRQAS